MKKLYKKDSNGKVLEWYIETDNNEIQPCIIIITGYYSGSKIHHSIPVEEKDMNFVILSKYKKKYMQGWLSKEDLKIVNVNEDILIRLLPNNLVDLNKKKKPQKANLFKEDLMSYPAIIQPKLNGLRCTISFEEVSIGEGFFQTREKKVVISSKEGIIYSMPHIEQLFKESDFLYVYKDTPINIIFDGELYCHGLPLNKIKSSVQYYLKSGGVSNSSGNPKDILFYCFDLSIEGVNQRDRIAIKDDILNNMGIIDFMNTNNYLVNVKSIYVNSDKEARDMANEFIKDGYEGGILRDTDSEYKFGHRNNSWLKLKKWSYTNCVILDVIHKTSSSISNKNRTYVTFLLKNDINDKVFEATPEGNEEDRLYYLNNKDSIIGKFAKVKYRERSGIAKVPFQCNVIEVLTN